MKQSLVLASSNAGKLREISQLLSALDAAVVAQSELGVPEVAETGLTFVENAILKARNAANHSGRAAIADDSGLEVDALRGAPGVQSARYAGVGAADAANVAKLLAELCDVAEANRSARFHCAVAYLRHAQDPVPIITQASWEGRIATAPRGTNGFGYDPVFLVTSHGCTAAELPADEKNRLSHRGRALRGLVAALRARPDGSR